MSRRKSEVRHGAGNNDDSDGGWSDEENNAASAATAHPTRTNSVTFKPAVRFLLFSLKYSSSLILT